MCVGIFKPAGKKIDKETLKACFQANPDGAGFAWFNGKQIVLSKGYFNFDDWARQVKKIPVEAPALLHARIRTHGETSAANCHPFPVSANPKALETQDCVIKSGFVAIHNGIISGMKAANGVDIKHSDTMQFIAQILAPFIKKFDPMKGLGYRIVDQLIDGSRFALMEAHNGNVALYGDWDNDEKTGLYFSNNAWRHKSTVYSYSSGSYSMRQCTFDDDEYWQKQYELYRQEKE